MPETPEQIVVRVFRENKRYSGDGLANEPVGAPLPVGDPASGPWNPKKVDLREALLAPLAGSTANAAYAEEQADRSEAEADRSETAANIASTVMTTVLDPQFAALAAAEAYSPAQAPDYIRTAGHSAAGDGGGALYKKVGSEPSHAGKFSITLDDGSTVVWYEIAEAVLEPEMFGGIIHTHIQAAIDTANAKGGGVVFGGALNGPYEIGDTVTVKRGVRCELQDAIPTADVDQFHVNDEAQFRLHNWHYDEIPTFDSWVCTGKPTQNMRGGEHNQPWIELDRIEFLNPDTDPSYGRALLFDATEFYIGMMTAKVNHYFGNVGIEMRGGADDTKWTNGHTIHITSHNAVDAILENQAAPVGSEETGAVAGNKYYGSIQHNAFKAARVTLNDNSMCIGDLWDRPEIVFAGNDNYILSTTAWTNSDILTDNGRRNTLIGRDQHYHDGRSVQRNGDARNYQDGIPGEIVFRENFQHGSRAGVWDLQASGGGASYIQYDHGTGDVTLCGTRLQFGTGTTSGNSGFLRFATPGIKAGHNPKLFATVGAIAANAKHQIGFWKDSENHIIFESDPDNSRWIVRCVSGGVATEDTSLALNVSHIHFMSIEVRNDEVIFGYGSASAGGGSIGSGAQNIGSFVTIETNIPTAEFIGPWFYVETLESAAKSMHVYDVQVIHSYYKRAP